MKKISFSATHSAFLTFTLVITLIVASLATIQVRRIEVLAHQSVLNLNRPHSSGRLYFVQPTYTAHTNSSSTLQLVLDNGGFPIEKADIVLTYPPESLMVETVTLDPNFCPGNGQHDIDPISGAIIISCLSNPGHTQLQVQTVASISYRALKSGAANFHSEPSLTHFISTNQTEVSFNQSNPDFPLTLLAE